MGAPTLPANASGYVDAATLEAAITETLAIQDGVLQQKARLEALNVPGSAVRNRHASIAITYVEDGILRLAQYRTELEDRLRAMQVAPAEGIEP